MRELTKSIASSSWALTLFGAEQAAQLASAVPKGRATLNSQATAFDSLSAVAVDELDERIGRLFELGDNAQKGMIEFAEQALKRNISGLARPGLEVAEPVVQSLGLLTPQKDWLIDWQELKNKVDIYDLVRNVEDRLNVADGAPIAELVERAYALGDFHALWAVEGLGNYYAVQAMKLTDSPTGLLSAPNELGIPDKSLTMMNAGLGLAFAEHLLKEFTSLNGLSDINEVVSHFVTLCENNTTQGYTGCALESLGLVSKTFFPSTVDRLDQAIQSTTDEALLGYFWHGVGRGNYFAPRNFLPCGRVSLNQLTRQSTHTTGQQNLIAGLTWAITLVNMRTPDVMQRYERQVSPGHRREFRPAFSNGAASSVAMRLDVTPSTPIVEAFFNVTEGSSWRNSVGHCCRRAMSSEHLSSRGPEVWFRYTHGSLKGSHSMA